MLRSTISLTLLLAGYGNCHKFESVAKHPNFYHVTVGNAAAVISFFQCRVLQVGHGQRIKRLTACLSNQTLRIDCAYERKTTNPLSYEFRLFKGSGDGTVVAGNSSVASAPYRLRTNITTNNNLVCLYLNGFTTSDEGVYTCKLKIINDYEDMQSRDITVVKAQLARCAGISVFIQNTSWLLLLLLSLPLLQAVDFVSL